MKKEGKEGKEGDIFIPPRKFCCTAKNILFRREKILIPRKICYSAAKNILYRRVSLSAKG